METTAGKVGVRARKRRATKWNGTEDGASRNPGEMLPGFMHNDSEDGMLVTRRRRLRGEGGTDP